jgi:hypothetical protein
MPQRTIRLPLLVWVTLALATPLTLPWPPAPQAATHHLRGPALKKGLRLAVSTSVTLNGGALHVKRGGATQTILLTVVHEQETTVEVAEVMGRQPTGVVTRVVKDQTRQTQGNPPESPIRSNGLLDGRTIISRLEKGAWANTPEQATTNANVQFALSLYRPWSPQDELFPARAARVGDTWAVELKDLTTFPCAMFSPRPGSCTIKGKGRLRAVEKGLGQPCAVVDFRLALDGKEKNGRVWQATLKMTVHRSLRWGISLKSVCESELKVADAGGGMRLTGKQKAETVVTVKE